MSRFPISLRRAAITLVTILLASLCASGCYRRVSYTGPDGRRVELVNVGFDTSIGRLEAETPNGSLRLENLNSRAELVHRLADLAAALAQQGK